MPASSPSPTIFVVSGGVGASGEQLAYTLLVQFPRDAVHVITLGSVRRPEQVDELLQEARSQDALVLYTLVDAALSAHLAQQAQTLGVQVIDLMGPLMDWVTTRLGILPKGEPGLYRQLRREYFDRVSAIDYMMAHDDGKDPTGWPQAECLLVGVSRVGKTPLSAYLAVLGWKVANYPIVPQIPLQQTLFSLDPGCVFGLTTTVGQLLQHRRGRQDNLGAPGPSAYVDPTEIRGEVHAALDVFDQGGFRVIDMTDKTIELAADEIIHHITHDYRD